MENNIPNVNPFILSKLSQILNNPDIINQIDAALGLDTNVEIVGLTFQTNKYNKFKDLDGNRDINKTNLEKIKKSISDIGYQYSQPITVDMLLNVINGQHRKEACIQLGLPIIFNMQYTQDSLKITQDINKSQKNWAILDYIQSYANRGFIAYQKFLNLIDNEKITISLAIWLIYRSRNGNIQEQIKNGDLICNDEHIADIQKTLRLLTQIKDAIPNNLEKERKLRNSIFTDKFAVPLTTLMQEPQYNHLRMVKQISKLYNSVDISNMSNCGNSLVQIYNFNLKDNTNKLRSYSDLTNIN